MNERMNSRNICHCNDMFIRTTNNVGDKSTPDTGKAVGVWREIRSNCCLQGHWWDLDFY